MVSLNELKQKEEKTESKDVENKLVLPRHYLILEIKQLIKQVN